MLVDRAGREQKDLVEPLNQTRRDAWARVEEAEEVLKKAQSELTLGRGEVSKRLEKKKADEHHVWSRTSELMKAARDLGTTKEQLDGRGQRSWCMPYLQ